MKVVFQDNVTPRIDGNPAKINNLRSDKHYEVYGIEFRGEEKMFVVLNEDLKLARYAAFRFSVVEDTPLRTLREDFNKLTSGMRGAWKREQF